jgi:hypothetical protein
MQQVDLNSPLPKPWLNIQTNSLTANNITAQSFTIGTLELSQLILSGTVQTINTSSSTITLQASDLISGVIGLVVTGTGTVNVNLQLPTGASLDAALTSATQPFYFTTVITSDFNTSITQGNINILLNSNITCFSGVNPLSYVAYLNTSPLTNMNKFQRVLVFSRNNTGWILYG